MTYILLCASSNVLIVVFALSVLLRGLVGHSWNRKAYFNELVSLILFLIGA